MNQKATGPFNTSGIRRAIRREVDVDTETGLVTVKKIVAIHDCGLIIDTLTLESQINGGVIMGMGYALYEGRVMDDLSGVMLNPNFETYKLAGIADVPDIQVVLLNMPERGVIGIGEPATVPTAAAIGNAVANAIGVRVEQPAHHAVESFGCPRQSSACHYNMKAFSAPLRNPRTAPRKWLPTTACTWPAGNDLLGLLKRLPRPRSQNPRQRQIAAGDGRD